MKYDKSMVNKRAKELFFKSNGQYYNNNDYLSEEYNEYRKYNISKKIEKKWIKEILKIKLSKFKQSAKTKYLIPLIKYFTEYELLAELLIEMNENICIKILKNMAIKKAKEIYFMNDGDYYYMAHDGFYEEYLEYKIDKPTEEKWKKELIQLNRKEFKKTSDITYLIPLVELYNQYELLNELLSVKNRINDINELVIIELLSILLYKNKNKIEDIKEKKMIVKERIKNFIQEVVPKVSDPEHYIQRIDKVKRRLRIK